jgi:methyl-accepting chemotaxis protein
MTKKFAVNIKTLLAKITNISSFKTIRAKLLSAFILTIIPVILLGAVSFSIAKNALEKKARNLQLIQWRRQRIILN